MAKKLIQKEIDEWLESDNETALIEIAKITDDKIDFNIGEEEEKFSVTYPKDYPNSTEKFFVFSEEENLSEWQQQLNEYAEKPKLKIEQLLTKEILSESVLKEVCTNLVKTLVNEPNVIQIHSPVTIVGDIHGQFYDLLELFKVAGPFPDINYLFLGNYINRGYYSVETISLLACLKLRYPHRVTLLRGNHETMALTQVYGFYGECMRKYGNPNVWRHFTVMFDYLPIAATIDNSIFCVHAGLSPLCSTLDQIRLLHRFQEVPTEGAITDLLWSDPNAESTSSSFGTSPRGAGKLYSSEAVLKFLRINNLSHMARSHQLCIDGFQTLFDGKFSTIWSAPDFCYRCSNVACVLEVFESLEKRYNVFTAAPETQEFRPKTDPTKDIPDYFI